MRQIDADGVRGSNPAKLPRTPFGASLTIDKINRPTTDVVGQRGGRAATTSTLLPLAAVQSTNFDSRRCYAGIRDGDVF
jgi:hypothetical protein